MHEIDQELKGGELSPSACPGEGNRPPGEKKFQIPRGTPRGGKLKVTRQIELCIKRE